MQSPVNTPVNTPSDQPAFVYPDNSLTKNAELLTRLRTRRYTRRTLLVYATAVGLLVFATPWGPTFLAGSIAVGVGLALRIWTFGHLRKNQTVITTGPYAYTRNPAYLGSVVILAGLFLAAGNPFTPVGLGIWMAGLVGLYVFFHYYLPRKYSREYGRLDVLFSELLQRHAAHVPDFFPRMTPWRSGDAQAFSWACVRANHELIWPVACVSALIVMWWT